MYDPTIGQWLSEDPIGFDALDPNLRRYVENRPSSLTDPKGLAPSGTSGHGTPQADGMEAHRQFGKGTKLPVCGAKGPITDRLEVYKNRVIVNELKPADRLKNASKMKAALDQVTDQMEAAEVNYPNHKVVGKLSQWSRGKNGTFRFTLVRTLGKARRGIPCVSTFVGTLIWSENVDAVGMEWGSINFLLDEFGPPIKGNIEDAYDIWDRLQEMREQ